MISFRKNIDCETFRNVAFLLVLPTANGECSMCCRQKVRFAMFSCYFLRIIRQSIQVLCPVFSRKVFFRGVEGSNKVWTSKTSLGVTRQDFVEHGGRVISAAKRREIVHAPLVATNDLLSESPNSIFGTSFFLRETMNSLPGTNKLAFSGNMNFLMGKDPVLREIIDSELKSYATVGSIIMVNTDNGFFDCHAEHADQNRLLDTDINLSTVSLSSDDELLIKCDENTFYMCDTLSSVNNKNYGK